MPPKNSPEFGRRSDGRDEPLPPDCPFPGTNPFLSEEEELTWAREVEAEERERERQHREDREIEERANAVLRSMPRRRKRWAKMQRDWARSKLAQRPRKQLVFPSPRERRAAPVRREGSRRSTAPSRAGPDDPGDPDPDGEHNPLNAARGTATGGTA